MVNDQDLTAILGLKFEITSYNFHFSSIGIKWFIVVEGKRNADSRQSFAFLRKEIPVRLANIMNEISLQPSVLRQMPSVQQVAGW